jgi:hypothetical protein
MLALSVNDRFWDVATIDEIDAMQRQKTTACPSNERPLRHQSMAALLSGAESQRSSALASRPRRHRFTTQWLRDDRDQTASYTTCGDMNIVFRRLMLSSGGAITFNAMNRV